MRVLVVSNMKADAFSPHRGQFVRDQVAAIKEIGHPGLSVELYEYPPGNHLAAALKTRRMFAGKSFDVLHSHFGLTAVNALNISANKRVVTLHGRDLRHRKTRPFTVAGLHTQDLIGLASGDLLSWLPSSFRDKAVPLPMGVDLSRCFQTTKSAARSHLKLPQDEKFLLFPYDQDRAVKRFDRAEALADATSTKLIALGSTPPSEMAWWFNAADAVVIPSMHEGFGLAAVEAIACGATVLATPTGAHVDTVGVANECLCAEWNLEVWSSFIRQELDQIEAQVDRPAERSASLLDEQPLQRKQQRLAVAKQHSTVHYAKKVVDAWTTLHTPLARLSIDNTILQTSVNDRAAMPSRINISSLRNRLRKEAPEFESESVATAFEPADQPVSEVSTKAAVTAATSNESAQVSGSHLLKDSTPASAQAATTSGTGEPELTSQQVASESSAESSHTETEAASSEPKTQLGGSEQPTAVHQQAATTDQASKSEVSNSPVESATTSPAKSSELAQQELALPATAAKQPSRGKLNRRLRHLRQIREISYRDLGGLVFELHRAGHRNDPLVTAKLDALKAIDSDVLAIENALNTRSGPVDLRIAGISCCQACSEVIFSDSKYCHRCGNAVSKQASSAVPTEQ